MNNIINDIPENTSSIIQNDSYKYINYKFGEYNISIKLNEKNEFAGVEKISIDKVFYNYTNIKTEYDVSKFYED